MQQRTIVQKIVVGAIIFYREKTLILQRSATDPYFPNLWELPSGSREPLETSEKTLLREVKEETGLDITIIQPIAVFDYQVEKPHVIKDVTQVNFLVTLANSQHVILSSEHQDFRWVDLDDLDSYTISTETKQVLRKAFAFWNGRQ